MPAYRFYCPSLMNHDSPLIEGSELDHLCKVMRQKVGDVVELVDGRGSFALASISHLDKKKALLTLQQIQSYELSHDLTLYQSLTNWTHLEWIVEKSVELGATRIVLFPSSHSPFPLSEKKQERLLLKAISALKQSGRFFLPSFEFLSSLEKIVRAPSHAFFGDLRDNAPILNFEHLQDSPSSCYAFASGPESGFTNHEQTLLEKKGFLGVRIHTNILRAETAPLSFLSLVHHHLMLKRQAPLVN